MGEIDDGFIRSEAAKQAGRSKSPSLANIAIIKEQRDALDHIMLALNKALNDPPDDSEFRESLPDEVQQWLANIENDIDGMTLGRIEREADKLAGEDSPEADKLYQLGRRVFYARMQAIVDIMFPGQGVEVGINLLWVQVTNELPGGAVSDALMDGENINRNRLIDLKDAGVAVD